MGALYKGFWVTAALSVPAHLRDLSRAGRPQRVIGGARSGRLDVDARSPRQTGGFTGWDLFWCMLVGLAVTGLIVWITEYYTGTNYRPVQSIAKASRDRPRHQRHPGPGDQP